MLRLLYKLLIGPVDIYFEAVYNFANDLFGYTWLIIIPLSLSISFICLPFYRRAEAIQAEERALEKDMEEGVRHIRTAFSGDEKFFMLQAYYRIKNYHPLYVFKSMLPLVLQVPFFITAYRFLSGLKGFDGQSFGIIHNLGAPDGMLTICGISINVLPVLMTLINLLSGYIYAKDYTRREKIQLYGIALLFLVLLYKSPAILVLYWICNNLFSLIRNKIDKSRNRAFLQSAVLTGLAAFFFLSALSASIINGEHHLFAYFTSAVLLAAAAGITAGDRLTVHKNYLSHFELSDKYFFAGCAFLTVLTGLLIPSALISSSPGEFVVLSAYQSPLVYLLDSLATAMGLFIVWFGFFFYLLKKNDRKWFNAFIVVLAAIATADYLFFGTRLGSLSTFLQYDETPAFAWKEIILNAGVLIIISAAILLVWLRREQAIRRITAIALIVALGMTGYNALKTTHDLNTLSDAASKNSTEDLASYSLSKNGKNVVVIMLDKAVSSFVPYIFTEKPELKESFDGFIWYPNTISYGWSTNIGSPAIYGGYEYTPEEMNRRSDEWLGDKHDEALKLMPAIFDDAGFDVNVSDPPYAGYSETPDLSIFDDYPDIKTWITESGQFRYLLEDFDAEDETKPSVWHRNFFYYSLMKTVPLGFQNFVYQEGRYLKPGELHTDLAYVQHTTGISTSEGVKDKAVNSYAALKALPGITKTNEKENGSFLMLYNSTAHEPMLYQTPDYIASMYVDNTDYDSSHMSRFQVDGKSIKVNNLKQITYYHANMAALLQLGEWFDWMRDNNVYDNTRIIIVADHGKDLGCFEDLILDDKKDIMYYNPLLMVKDFNSEGFNADYTFMTNADTPALAFGRLIQNPVNPFTGNPVSDEAKYEGEQHVLTSGSHKISENNGNTFLPGDWYGVKDNVLDRNNWRYLGKK